MATAAGTIISTLHGMPWLKHGSTLSKNNQSSAANDEAVVSAKKTNEDYFSGTREKKKNKTKKNKKQKSILTMADLNELENVADQSNRVFEDDTKDVPKVQGNEKEPECLVSDSNNEEPKTVWSTNTNIADKLFPNVQSLRIDRAEEEEMLSMALAESIATAQLERFKHESPKCVENRWEALYGDKEDCGWDNVRTNLPVSDSNNNAPRSGILRNGNETVHTIAAASHQNDFTFKKRPNNIQVQEKKPRTVKSVAFSSVIKVETFTNDSHSNSEEDVGLPKISDTPKSDMKIPNSNDTRDQISLNETFIDKFGRVDGYSERRLFMGKGARFKEEQYLKQKLERETANSQSKHIEITSDAQKETRTQETGLRNVSKCEQSEYLIKTENKMVSFSSTHASKQKVSNRPVQRTGHKKSEKTESTRVESLKHSRLKNESENAKIKKEPVANIQAIQTSSTRDLTSDLHLNLNSNTKTTKDLSSFDESIQKIVTSTEKCVPVDPELISLPKFAEITKEISPETLHTTTVDPKESKHGNPNPILNPDNGPENTHGDVDSQINTNTDATKIKTELLVSNQSEKKSHIQDFNVTSEHDAVVDPAEKNENSKNVSQLDITHPSSIELYNSSPCLVNTGAYVSEVPRIKLLPADQQCVELFNLLHQSSVCQNLHLSNIPCPNPNCDMTNFMMQNSESEYITSKSPDADIKPCIAKSVNVPHVMSAEVYQLDESSETPSLVNRHINLGSAIPTPANNMKMLHMNYAPVQQYFIPQCSSTQNYGIPETPQADTTLLTRNKETPPAAAFVNGVPPVKAFSNTNHVLWKNVKAQACLTLPSFDCKTESKQETNSENVEENNISYKNANNDSGILEKSKKPNSKRNKNRGHKKTAELNYDDPTTEPHLPMAHANRNQREKNVTGSSLSERVYAEQYARHPQHYAPAYHQQESRFNPASKLYPNRENFNKMKVRRCEGTKASSYSHSKQGQQGKYGESCNDQNGKSFVRDKEKQVREQTAIVSAVGDRGPDVYSVESESNNNQLNPDAANVNTRNNYEKQHDCVPRVNKLSIYPISSESDFQNQCPNIMHPIPVATSYLTNSNPMMSQQFDYHPNVMTPPPHLGLNSFDPSAYPQMQFYQIPPNMMNASYVPINATSCMTDGHSYNVPNSAVLPQFVNFSIPPPNPPPYVCLPPPGIPPPHVQHAHHPACNLPNYNFCPNIMTQFVPDNLAYPDIYPNQIPNDFPNPQHSEYTGTKIDKVSNQNKASRGRGRLLDKDLQ